MNCRDIVMLNLIQYLDHSSSPEIAGMN